MNGYEATYRQHAWNTVTFGIPALIAGVAEDFDKGTNNTMQALGGFFFGSALGPAVGAVWRPVQVALRPYILGAYLDLFPPTGLGARPRPLHELVVEPNLEGKLILDVGCGSNGSLAAPRLPKDFVIGIDPLLKNPGRGGLKASIFDPWIRIRFRGKVDEIILTGCKTGKDNVNLLEQTCAELLNEGGRVTVIDQFRGGCTGRSNQKPTNPDTNFDGQFLQLIEGCEKKGPYPLPKWAEGMPFYETDGMPFKPHIFWRSWIYSRRR